MKENEIKTGDLTIQEKSENGKNRVYVTDGEQEVRFTKFRKGVYTYGKQKIIDAVEHSRKILEDDLDLTESSINIIKAVSENEGNLDAVNTWDNSFMTFGMFQWTAGADSNSGELAALLQKIKLTYPTKFQDYFGRHGLDVMNVNGNYGYLSLNGKQLKLPEEKRQLRTPEWAFYFWKSGQDPAVQSVQIQHALSRIETFYHSKQYLPAGYFIQELISSEYGVCLLLDNHVNRPGYITPCLAEALKQTELPAPEHWGTEDEKKLIEAYLKVRKVYGKFPMTDAEKRAQVTKKYLNKGTISMERGSFQSKSNNS